MSKFSIHVEAAIYPEGYDVNNFIKLSGQAPLQKVKFYDYITGLYDSNNITICAGYAPGPKNISILNCDLNLLSKYITLHHKPGYKVIFDNSIEGGAGKLFARLHELANLTTIPTENFVLVNALCNNKDIYDEFCKVNNIKDRIQVYGINTCEIMSQKNLKHLQNKNIDELINNEKNKTYLCFNRILREHRLFLLTLILKKNLLHSGFYSFFPSCSYNKIKGIDAIDSMFNLRKDSLGSEFVDDLKQIYREHEHLMPLKLNIEEFLNKNYIDISDFKFFYNSLFSLVTETFYFENKIDNYMGLGYECRDGHGILFSEKIFKPIIMCHPFIIVSRPKSLHYLKKLGYHTFSPYINEEYDNIDNDKDRLLAIVEEVNRIDKFSESEKLNWLRNVIPIAVGNYEVLKNKTNFLLDY